jgi:tetratricopeptide (TPR) repeat protein
MTRDPDHQPEHETGHHAGHPTGHAAAGALAPLEQGADATPLDPSLHRALAEARRAAGDELSALAHLIAAHTLDTYASGSPEANAANLCDVATGYFMKGDHEIAARWYQLVLTLDPNLAVACQNLAAIHANAGRTAQAEAYRERTYRIQRVFIEQAPGQVRRVLVLCAARTSGNVPFESLLPGALNCRIKYAIDYAADDEDAHLPPFDLVFNAIGEADVAEPLAARLARFVKRCGRPLLNAPAAIARTSRNQIPGLLGDLPDVQIAPCLRIDSPAPSQAELAGLLASHGVAMPVLARPAATHGGEGLVQCESLAALETRLHELEGAQYLTAFRDFRSADGHYRKYRIIFVDREPFPYHLAISSHWMVHYFSADMESHAWKLDEERRFLQDPVAALGERAMRAIAAIGRRLDLYYGGIDFTLLPDGQVFVFEANATMLAHYERNSGALAHKNPFVRQIVDAFEQLMKRRTAA